MGMEYVDEGIGTAKIPLKRLVSNRFLLFAGGCYYALGGGHDFIGSFEVLEDAVAEGKRQVDDMAYYDIDWFHVFDVLSCEIVARSEVQAHGVD